MVGSAVQVVADTADPMGAGGRALAIVRGAAGAMDDDHALVIDAAGGSREAFESLVRRHTDAVWRMARARLRDDFAAEEATQDTFLKAYRNLHTFRGESAVRTWLLSICHRTCIDRLRLKRAELVSLEDARPLRSPEERPDLKVALEAAMEHLAPEEREAFQLVDVLGYSREEAAAVVGVPSSTMRSRVARARERLARELGGRREMAGG